jgi:hypothetical protein
MLNNHSRPLALIIAASLLAVLPLTRTSAAAADYSFQLVGVHQATPDATDVTIRLLHVPDTKPVSGAIIFQPRAVMPGMESMPGAATARPGEQPGTYVLRVSTSMAGRWTLQLSTKVQGETDTLRAAIPFEAGE